MAQQGKGHPRHYYEHAYLGSAHDRNARRTWIVMILNALAMVVEIATGWITGSMALLADGFHMATDAGALAVAAIAYAYARRHVHNARFTFGTGKVGDLAAFASAIILGLAAIGIAVEAVLRLIYPLTVRYDEAIIVAILGLVVNVGSAMLLMKDGGHVHGPGHGHSHSHAHHDHDHGNGHDHNHAHNHDHAPGVAGQDNNLRAAYLHLVADAVTSAMAIIALVAARMTGWVWLDAVTGLAGAILIARWSVMLMRDSAAVLLDTADDALLEAIRAKAERTGATIADLHVWRIGPEAHAAILSVPGGDAQAVRTALSDISGLEHVTVECR
ncbi:CDF family Co(II)/Ni(II) efflux transporter DmeF [Sphingobium phenoxybenzoativorans]|uniref:CDF family Co(II)/Ni(II) efflux transporter DmeF n=1 Tax=Sphingobium phenoxybenzoativorans TaxID=1592790 RepID=UPI0008720D7A|nr:CDF family Co(II)/Ni(II) efflux transporter DmeF [Sphingobium phenoxybenzoativorans]